MSKKNITARRLTAAVLTAGALTAVLAVPTSAAEARPHRPTVEISDVQYDSPGRDDRSRRSLNREWVEITNNSRRTINLDGWTLRDEDGHRYTFDDYRLRGRSTVRAHTGISPRHPHRRLPGHPPLRLGQPLRHRHLPQRPRSLRRQRVLGPAPWRTPLIPNR